jgi:hypothetical protein
VIDGSDKGAPTVRNTILKIATYVADNATAFARGSKSVSAAETQEKTQRIAEIGKELERLGNESEKRQISYSEFEALLEKLHRLAFYPTNKQVRDISHAIRGEEVHAV